MTYRSIAAIMAGLLCALCGFRHAAFMREEARRLSRWGDLLERLSLLLKEAVLPLPELLESAADGNEQPDRLLRDAAKDIRSSPLLPFHDALDQRCPACAGRDALLRMAEGISRGSAESRNLAASQAAAYIRSLAGTAQARAAQDARMWQTLGWSGGVCLALLLL